MSETLDNEYTFDTGMLVEPIRQETVARKLIAFNTSLPVSGKELDIESFIEDVIINVGLDPGQARKMAFEMKKNTYKIPYISVALSYNRHQLARISGSKLPYNARVAAAGNYFAKVEDAFIYASTFTGFQDDMSEFKSLTKTGSYTAASSDLDLTSYTTARSTLVGMLEQLITTFGNLKSYEIVLVVTNDVLARMFKITNTYDGEDIYDMSNRVLKNIGAPNSRVVNAPYLGGTLTKTDEGLTPATGSTNALLYINSKKYWDVYTSPFEAPTSQDPITGVEVEIGERIFPYVFKSEALIYSSNVDITS